MNVIMTHEQADMDALASQLGAWLLFPDVIPLLPRSINRNGRRFLEQYGADLPYVAHKDLPREPVETLFLVDTQSLITIKGMSKETRIVVYDHHPNGKTSTRNGSVTWYLTEPIPARWWHASVSRASP